MKKILVGFILICVSFGFSGTSAGSEQRRKFVATGDNVNIRARALLTSEVVGQLDSGEEVFIKGSEGEWSEIVPPFKIDLWVYSDFVSESAVTSPRVNVRAGPGINFSIVGQLLKGDVVAVRGQSGDWINIEPPEKCSLWVASSFIEPVVEQKPEIPEVVEEPVVVEELPATTEEVVVVEETVVIEELPETAEEVVVVEDVVEEIVEIETFMADDAAKLVGEEMVEVDEETQEIEPFQGADDVLSSGDRVADSESEFISTPDDLDLVPVQEQGNINTYTGILRPPGRLFNRPSQFRIIEYKENGERVMRCYVKGNTTQLRALLGRKMTITGREYWVQGERYPVLVPERIVVEY